MMTNKTVILIQGPEYSKEKRVKDLQNQGISLSGNVEIKGIDDNFIQIQKFFKNKKQFEFFTVGDSQTSITKEEIKSTLHEAGKYIANNTNHEVPVILISVHGSAANTPNSEITPHCLGISLEPEKLLLYTGELFRLINDYIKIPVELLFFSCESGPAIKCVHLLPKDSKLVTFSNDNSVVSNASISGFEYLLKHNIQDFSIKNLLEAAVLNGFSQSAGLKTTVSVSGKNINTFENFYYSLLGNSQENQKLLSLDKQELKEIYEEFEKFGFHSLVQELLQDDSISLEEIIKHLSVRPTFMQKLEDYCRPWGEKPNESIKEILDNINPYTKLDEALYDLTTNPDFSYRNDYIHYSDGNEYGINTHHSKNEKLAILLFKYLQQENNSTVSSETLNKLKNEIDFFTILQKPNQFEFESSILDFVEELKVIGNLEEI